MLKKSLAAMIMVLFLCISVIPDVIGDNPTNRAIYVDDDGGADYTRIQDAIDNASYGDTIFVYNGSYYEDIKIEKSINLFGEKGKYSPIIYGKNESDYSKISVSTSDATIKGFTITRRTSGLLGIAIYESSNK